MYILQRRMPFFGSLLIAAHQDHARLLIKYRSLLRLVICSLAKLQAVFKSLLRPAPIPLYSSYFTQNAIYRDAVIHKAMQSLNALNVSGSLLVCAKVQVSFSKKWDVEMATISDRFCQCYRLIQLRLCS